MPHPHTIIKPREATHLDALLLAWRAAPTPAPTKADPLTIALWKAVALDVIAKCAEHCRWNVIADPRVLWALQYIRIARGEARRIDPDITANVDFILSPHLPPLPPSGKDRAANDHERIQ